MGRLLKYSLFLLIIALIVAIGAAIAVVALVDPDDYRDTIAEAVEAQTGRELTIDGQLSLSLFPCCGVDVGASRLSNPPGYPAGDFAAFEQVGLRIEVWPLLTRRELIVGSVNVDGLVLNLVQRDAGSNNWMFEPTTTAEAGSSPDDAADSGEPLPQLSIDAIRVRDARLSYSDLATGQRISVTDLQFETGPVAPGEPIRFQLELAGRDEASDIDAALAVDGTGTLDLQAQVLSLDGLSGSIELADMATIKPMTLGTVTYELESGDARLDDFSARIDYQDVIAGVTAAATITNGDVAGQGSLEIEPFSPRALLEAQGTALATADSAALSKAEARMDFALSADRLTIRQLAAVLDDTRISGGASIADFDKPAVKIDLQLDAIDLDRYLAPAEESADNAPASGESAPDDQLPLETLRSLNVTGQLDIASLRVVDLALTDFSASLAARDGDIRLEPLKLALYGGSLDGKLRLDARRDRARLTLTQTLRSVDASALLGDLADATELTGTLNGDIALSSEAATQSALIDALAGPVSGRLNDGAYEGVDLWHEIGVARALIRRKAPPPAPTAPRTPINEMSVQATVGGETLNIEQLVAEIPFLRLTGRGTVDGASQALNLKFDGNVLEAPQLENGEFLSDLKGLTIPLTLTGPFDSPKVGVDLKNLTKSVAEDKLREKLLEELGEGEAPEPGEKESSGDVLRRGLRDLLKR